MKQNEMKKKKEFVSSRKSREESERKTLKKKRKTIWCNGIDLKWLMIEFPGYRFQWANFRSTIQRHSFIKSVHNKLYLFECILQNVCYAVASCLSWDGDDSRVIPLCCYVAAICCMATDIGIWELCFWKGLIFFILYKMLPFPPDCFHSPKYFSRIQYTNSVYSSLSKFWVLIKSWENNDNQSLHV